MLRAAHPFADPALPRREQHPRMFDAPSLQAVRPPARVLPPLDRIAKLPIVDRAAPIRPPEHEQPEVRLHPPVALGHLGEAAGDILARHLVEPPPKPALQPHLGASPVQPQRSVRNGPRAEPRLYRLAHARKSPRKGTFARRIPAVARAPEQRLRLLARGARRELRIPPQGELPVPVGAPPLSGPILHEEAARGTSEDPTD